MTDNHNYCIILAGGIGSRFWPISRESLPKQFLDITLSGKTMARQAFERAIRIVPLSHIFVVTLTKYVGNVKSIIPELPEENILMEPYGRSTAASIAFASYHIRLIDPEAVTVVTPSDHSIPFSEEFDQTVVKAMDYAAANDVLVTLGIVPTRPDSNFGYIQIDGNRINYGEPVKVKTFTEKPDTTLAKVFIETGEFLWNCGIFVWKASLICSELEALEPLIGGLWKDWETSLCSEGRTEYLRRVYADCPKTSIDYAVMEKSDKVWAIPAAFDWADIGNWESLRTYMGTNDSQNNAFRVGGPALLKEDKNLIVYSPHKNKLVAISNLENYIVIDTDDVLMICPCDDRKQKELLSQLAMPDFEKYR